ASALEPGPGQYTQSQVQPAGGRVEFPCGWERWEKRSGPSLPAWSHGAVLVRPGLGFERDHRAVAAALSAVRSHHHKLLPGKSRPIHLSRAPNQAGTALPQWSEPAGVLHLDRKSTRLNSSHVAISYAVFCLKKKKYTYNY